jgi:hypothetical protein
VCRLADNVEIEAFDIQLVLNQVIQLKQRHAFAHFLEFKIVGDCRPF